MDHLRTSGGHLVHTGAGHLAKCATSQCPNCLGLATPASWTITIVGHQLYTGCCFSSSAPSRWARYVGELNGTFIINETLSSGCIRSGFIPYLYWQEFSDSGCTNLVRQQNARCQLSIGIPNIIVQVTGLPKTIFQTVVATGCKAFSGSNSLTGSLGCFSPSVIGSGGIAYVTPNY